MEWLLLTLAIGMSLLTMIVVYIKLKSVYLNLYNLSKGLDILFANQDKILELTKLKSFVQLTNEETVHVREEIKKEKSFFGAETKRIVRSSESNKNDEGS